MVCVFFVSQQCLIKFFPHAKTTKLHYLILMSFSITFKVSDKETGFYMCVCVCVIHIYTYLKLTTKINLKTIQNFSQFLMKI